VDCHVVNEDSHAVTNYPGSSARLQHPPKRYSHRLGMSRKLSFPSGEYKYPPTSRGATLFYLRDPKMGTPLPAPGGEIQMHVNPMKVNEMFLGRS